MSFVMNRNRFLKGDMYYIKNDKFYGTEYGDGTGRPAIVVSSNEFNNDPNNPFLVIAYLTTKPKDNLPCHVPVMCVQNSTVLCESITRITKDRVGDFIRKADDVAIQRVEIALRDLLDIPVEEKVVEIEKPVEVAGDDAIYKKLYYELLDRMIANRGRA